MGLVGVLFRAVLALLLVVFMTLIIYPMTAVWIFLFVLRSERAHHTVWGMFRNAFTVAKPVQFSSERCGVVPQSKSSDEPSA